MGMSSSRRWLLLLLCVPVTLCGGCAWMRIAGAERAAVPEPREERTRAELLEMVRANMDRLGSITARARVVITQQDILVAASTLDEARRRAGKPYNKSFLRFDVNGSLALARWPNAPRKIRFEGSVVGADAGFTMLGVGDRFWISLPNPERSDDPDAPRGYTYYGDISQEAVRPRDRMSIRPQDVAELLLYDEVYAAVQGTSAGAGVGESAPETLCFREAWEGYYVLNFLQRDRPEYIVSRIWIERRKFRVTIHQIFDGSGEVVAEARFADYRTFRGPKSQIDVEVPTGIQFLWPRDGVVMDVRLSGIRVNEPIPETAWEFKPRRGYEMRPIGRLGGAE